MDVSAGALAAGSGALKAAAGLASGDAAPAREFAGELDDILKSALGLGGEEVLAEQPAEMSPEALEALTQSGLFASQTAHPLIGGGGLSSGATNNADEALDALGDVLAPRPEGPGSRAQMGGVDLPRGLGLGASGAPEDGKGLVPEGDSTGLPMRSSLFDGALDVAGEQEPLGTDVKGVKPSGVEVLKADGARGQEIPTQVAAERKWQSELPDVFRAPGAGAGSRVAGEPLSSQSQVEPPVSHATVTGEASNNGVAVKPGRAGNGLSAQTEGAVVAKSAEAVAASAIAQNVKPSPGPVTKASKEQVASLSDDVASDLKVSFGGVGSEGRAGADSAPLRSPAVSASNQSVNAAAVSPQTPELTLQSMAPAHMAGASQGADTVIEDVDVKISTAEMSFATELASTVKGGDMQGASRTESLQTPNQSQSSQVATQVAVEIARNLKNAQTRFQMRFDPPELGRVDVNMKVASDGSVQAHLIVERPETLDMFMRDQRGLERALEAAGLSSNPNDLQFSLKQDGGQQFASSDDQGQQNLEPGQAAAGSEDGVDDFVSEDVVRMTLAEQRGGLDLKI